MPTLPRAYCLRWMIDSDLSRVLAIESRSFTEPWCEEEFRRELRQRHVIPMVAEYGDAIAGYMLCELNGKNLTLINFAVAPDLRRTGIGTLLLNKLKYKVLSHRRERLVVMVSENNTAAHLFFRANGFRASGIVRDINPATGEDAYVFDWVPTEDDLRRYERDYEQDEPMPRSTRA